MDVNCVFSRVVSLRMCGWPRGVLSGLISTNAVLSQYDYTFNGVGDRTSVTEADGASQVWRYDPRRWLDEESQFAIRGPGWDCLLVDDWDQLSVDGWDTLPVGGCPDAQFSDFYDAPRRCGGNAHGRSSSRARIHNGNPSRPAVADQRKNARRGASPGVGENWRLSRIRP
jgi:hypothetical protein